MGKLFQQQEVLILILGSIISLISTIIGFFAQTFVTSILANKGKVKIYIKSVYNKMTGKPWGFQNSASQGLMFDVPLWIEIHNMKSTKQVIRNINLVLYNHRKVIGKTVQLSHYEEDGESKPYGENGSYTFLLAGNEIKRFDLEFAILQKDMEGKNFDEVRISYYDSKDNYHETPIFKINEPWKISKNKIDNDWRLIN
ncbi:Uncharacterised protein [Streptococcus agalactiae]|uniref:hypothetical protein n=1 Tax=Streptococcus TaxID=1301 RepID=UPI000E006D27|nr:hypothetical protein [Streptococcus agalactiae]SUN02344.1 Uncharacterised protein [Streptococcus agalactiae]